MIRPLTIVTCLLACGSGLYLYEEKHQVQLLDRTIERTVRDTNALREQSRLLAAEWTMLNDPERLRQFSDTYLSLKTINPGQFTSVADLDNRLPTPEAEVSTHGTDEPDVAPVAAGSVPSNGDRAASAPDNAVPDPVDPEEAAPGSAGLPAVAESTMPVPPIPAARAAQAPAVASVTRPGEPRSADRLATARAAAESQPRPVATAEGRQPDPRPADQRPTEPRAASRVTVADARATEPRPPEPHAAPRSLEARVEARPTADVRTAAAPPPRPIVLGSARPSPANAPASTAPVPRPVPAPAAPAPYSGSLLGMAHGSMPPSPRPTPVNATYNSN